MPDLPWLCYSYGAFILRVYWGRRHRQPGWCFSIRSADDRLLTESLFTWPTREEAKELAEGRAWLKARHLERQRWRGLHPEESEVREAVAA